MERQSTTLWSDNGVPFIVKAGLGEVVMPEYPFVAILFKMEKLLLP